MPITSLQLKNVGPFDDNQFLFDEHVNVFVGPNNSGKSCVLMAMSEIAVYPFEFPEKFLRPSEKTVFKLGYRTRSRINKSFTGKIPYGDILDNASKERAYVRFLDEIGYTKFIPALRWSSDFRSKGPMAKTTKEASKELLTNEEIGRALEGEQLKAIRPRRHLKGVNELDRRELASEEIGASMVEDTAIIQEIIELDYRAYRESKPEIRHLLDKVASLASEVTEGFPIEFAGVGEDKAGLFPKFKTPDGTLPLNCLSQGTQSIIQCWAHFLLGYARYYGFPKGLERQPGILFIDEIDAHLHPSWQRRIIPALKKNFPRLQLFCSTHSPLMLAGLKAGQVQLLKRDEKGRVSVTRNQTDIVGWSADEILRGFWDVEAPTDISTESHVRRLGELRNKKKLTKAEARELAQLRKRVRKDLLGGPIISEVGRLQEMIKDACDNTTQKG